MDLLNWKTSQFFRSVISTIVVIENGEKTSERYNEEDPNP